MFFLFPRRLSYFPDVCLIFQMFFLFPRYLSYFPDVCLISQMFILFPRCLSYFQDVCRQLLLDIAAQSALLVFPFDSIFCHIFILLFYTGPYLIHKLHVRLRGHFSVQNMGLTFSMWTARGVRAFTMPPEREMYR